MSGRLAGERAETVARIEALTARLEQIVAGSELNTDDDEHDPEGSTIAFERAQVTALLSMARRDLEELDAAAERLRAGTYGFCERCGERIGAARLDALPAARLCLRCSS